MEIIPKILIYWYITVFISTEILSYFNFINRPSIVLVNIIFFTVVLFICNKKIVVLLKNFLQKHSIYFYIIFVILGLTFLQGFLSAPNTTDSMVYHLPRVMYWVQEHTLYQDIIRNDHDFMAPFGEYLLLHLYLIFNSDKLLFLSQWLAFAITIVLSFIIAKQIEISDRVANYIAVLVASSPIAVMQSSSTQTDMVTTVLLMFSVYFALNFLKSPSLMNCLLFSVSIGFGIATKATFILFAIIPFGILLINILRERKQYFIVGLLSLLVIGIIQFRFLNQNLRIYGNFSGQNVLEGESVYLNEFINSSAILSNVIRNIFMHLPVPVAPQVIQNSIVSLHRIIGIDLNDSRTTYFDTKFSISSVIFPQEDIVGNPIHLVIIFLAGFFLILKRGKSRIINPEVYIYILAVFSFIVFSMILKWQPFHSRLQFPFFVIGSISAIAILSDYQKIRFILNYLLSVSIILAFILIILNVSRPYISYGLFYEAIKSFKPSLVSIPEAFYTKPRKQQYFNARFYWYEPYKRIIENLKKQSLNTNTITFKLMDGYEYPLWLFIKENNLNYYVIPESKISDETIIISTSKNPDSFKGYKTECIKTEIEYGYACISVKDGNI